MSKDHPIEDLAKAVYHALAVGLPDMSYRENWYKQPDGTESKFKRTPEGPSRTETKFYRPRIDQVDVVMFSQGWGSTSVMFGGIGGAAMTDAYTTVVSCLGVYAVYCCGMLAYVVDTRDADASRRAAFMNDLRAESLKGRMEAYKSYPTSLVKVEKGFYKLPEE